MKRLVLLVIALLVACTGQDYAPPKATAQLLTSDSLAPATMPTWLDTTWKFDTTLVVDTTRRVDSTMVVAKLGTPPAPLVRDSVSCVAATRTCTFTNLSVVPAGVVAFSYYFGDGTAAGPRSGNTAHTYRAAGTYWVRFAVTDSLHRSATAADSVRVGNVPIAPPPDTTPTQVDTTPKDTVVTPPPDTVASGPTHRPWMVAAYTDFLHPDTATLRLLASRFDRLTNGSAVWRTDNPAIEQYNYRLFFSVLITGGDSLGVSGSGTMDAWLTAHGFPLESAYLHHAGGPIAPTNRWTWFLKNSNGDSSTALNMSDAGVRAWQLSIVNDLKARGYAGVFYDIFGRGGMAKLFSSAEGDSTWYQHEITDALRAERAASGVRITINTASYNTPFDSMCAVAAGGVHLEKTNYPLGINLTGRQGLQYWQWADHLIAAGVTRIEFVSSLAWFDNVPASVGNDVSPMGREKMAEYASYLMVKDTGGVVAFAFDNYWRGKPAVMPAAAWDTSITNAKNHWLPAWDVNVGQPLGARAMVASGTDPVGQKYQVWSRAFAHATVIVRANISTPTNFGDSSAVAVPLSVPGRLLRSDGGLAQETATVQLRAGEGVVVLTP